MLTHREKAVRELTLITSGDFFFFLQMLGGI